MEEEEQSGISKTWTKFTNWISSIDWSGKNLMMIIIIGTGFLVCLAVFCKVCCCKTKIPIDDD
jgi:hypothetical protein